MFIKLIKDKIHIINYKLIMIKQTEFRGLIVLLFLMSLLSCKNNENSLTENDFHSLKLYKIMFYESYAHDGGFSFSSEYIIVNKSDTCIDNVKDVNKLNFVHPIFESKLRRIEYCSKGTFDINTQIAPGDTAFYKLTYRFFENISSFFIVLENPEKYLDIYKQRGYTEGPIRIIAHPSVKIYHSTNYIQNRKYPLPFYEEIEYRDKHLDKTPYEFLRFKYDNFYNK